MNIFGLFFSILIYFINIYFSNLIFYKYRGAGYRTLLSAVYKTSLLFQRPQVAVYKTLLFSESQNLQKVFFQIWLFIRPHLNF